MLPTDPLYELSVKLRRAARVKLRVLLDEDEHPPGRLEHIELWLGDAIEEALDVGYRFANSPAKAEGLLSLTEAEKKMWETGYTAPIEKWRRAIDEITEVNSNQGIHAIPDAVCSSGWYGQPANEKCPACHCLWREHKKVHGL